MTIAQRVEKTTDGESKRKFRVASYNSILLRACGESVFGRALHAHRELEGNG